MHVVELVDVGKISHQHELLKYHGTASRPGMGYSILVIVVTHSQVIYLICFISRGEGGL